MLVKLRCRQLLMIGTAVCGFIVQTSLAAPATVKKTPAPHGTKPSTSSSVKTSASAKDSTEPYYSSMGLGKTLPHNVLRVRTPLQSATGTYGYDASGKKTDMGFTLNVNAGALILEYGLTDSLSLQLLAPYVVRNSLALNGQKFGQSATYQEQADKFNTGVASVLAANGICADVPSCLNLIKSGYALPTDTPVTLPTGESFTFKAGIPIQTYTDSLVKNAANPQNGATGLGDIEIGALYALVHDDSFIFSLGAGFRLPTGKFTDVPSAQRNTGGGVTQFGFRVNVDWMAFSGFWLSWQNQTEAPLTAAKKHKSSLIDPNQPNSSDPTTDAAKASGSDGEPNEQTYTVKGLRQKGTLRFEYGLTDLGLMPLAIGAGYNYDLKQATELNGHANTNRAEIHSVSMLLKLNGLTPNLMFPASVELEHDQPIKGKNIPLAAITNSLTLKLYYRF